MTSEYGCEASKSNPCPICEHTDWCFQIDQWVWQCGRTDPGHQPDRWKHISDGSDGRPIYSMGKTGESQWKKAWRSQPKLKESTPIEIEKHDEGFDELMQKVGAMQRLREPRKSFALSRLAKRQGIAESRLLAWYFSHLKDSDDSERFDNGKDFMALDFGDQKWLVNGLVPRGAAILIAASPGTGKSYLAYCVAKAVLTGEGFGDRLSTTGKVLIVQGDEGKRTTQGKLEKLGFEDLDNWSIDFSTDFSNLYDLERRIVDNHYDLIICDSYSNLNAFCGFEEKDTGSANTAKTIRAMADRLGVTFLLIHHLNQRGTIRGTTALPAAVDECWQMTREDERSDSKRYFTWLKSRAECQGYYEVHWDSGTGEIRLEEHDESEEEKDSRPATIEEKLLVLFRQRKGTLFELRELAEDPFINAHYDTVRRAASKLESKGAIDKQRRTRGGSGYYYVYGISDPPPSRSDLRSDPNFVSLDKEDTSDEELPVSETDPKGKIGSIGSDRTPDPMRGGDEKQLPILDTFEDDDDPTYTWEH